MTRKDFEYIARTIAAMPKPYRAEVAARFAADFAIH